MSKGGARRNPPSAIYDEEHKYGFVKINARQYIKCANPCCKSGGPAFPNVHEGE